MHPRSRKRLAILVALSGVVVFDAVVAPAAAPTPEHAIQAPGELPATGRSVSPDAWRSLVWRIVAPDEPPPPGIQRPVRFSELVAMRTFFERVDVTETAAGISRPPPDAAGIAAVVAGLDAQWQAPFSYVRDRVGYVAYPGLVRGPQGTLEAGSANSLDQAELLRALFAARGVRTRLVRGRLGWEGAARLAVGTPPTSAPPANDPWPRWVEIAADHWWVEAQRDEEWIALDPSFPEAGIGEARGRETTTYEAPPDDLQAQVRIELLRGGDPIAEAEIETVGLLGNVVRARMTPARSAAVGGAAPSPTQARPGIGPPGRGSRRLPVEEFVVPSRHRERPAAGRWNARVDLPGRSIAAGPFEEGDLASLSLRVRARLPNGASQELRVPWGSRYDAEHYVAFGAGPVASARLATAARPLFSTLQELAAAELAARDAMRPPRDYWSGIERLRRASEAGWNVLAETGPVALAWSLLRVDDQLSAQPRVGKIVRQGVRMVAVSWAPPRSDRGGDIALVVDDPIVIGALTDGQDPGPLRFAYGLLQSAVVSQVLHGIAGVSPTTAFDVTLRAVGTDQGLGWWREESTLPESWPAAARALAVDDLRRGELVVGPRSPGSDERSGWGWWQLAPQDGGARGWVLTDAGRTQATVSFGIFAGATLDDTLAALPSLHRAIRWLAASASTEGGSLGDVSDTACAAAGIAAVSFRQALPSGWSLPDIRRFCAGR